MILFQIEESMEDFNKKISKTNLKKILNQEWKNKIYVYQFNEIFSMIDFLIELSKLNKKYSINCNYIDNNIVFFKDDLYSQKNDFKNLHKRTS